MNKTQLIRDFITKSKLKSKIAIAKAVFEKYPDKFKSVEDARTLVRYVTGSLGNHLRKDISNPELTKFFYNGFESWAKENLNTELRPWDDPFVIPDSIKVLNVIADLHSIHLDVNTYKAFLNNTKDKTA